MKKMIYFGLLTLSTCLFTACSTSERPGDAAQRYAQYLADAQYDKFIDGIAFDESYTSSQVEEWKELMITILNDNVKSEMDKKGGIQHTQILSEVVSPDGNSASVQFLQTFGNGESESSKFDMVKRDGTWKLVIDSLE